ncbi:MAG TPA: hypothetical protein VFQ53_28975 [Kofleriaceae bacterium]|nr:hypothetical protein [Kofleriaceae bacterium]
MPRQFVQTTVIVALAAVTACSRGRDAKADEAIAYLPDQTELVLGFNVKDLRDSPLWDDIDKSLARDAEYRSITKTCGIDLAEDIDHVVIGLTELRPTPEGVFVIKGKHVDKLLACDIGGKVKRDGKVVFYEDDSGEAVLALADSSTLVGVFGFHPSKAELDRALAKSNSLRDLPAFKELFADVHTGHTVWLVGKGSLVSDVDFDLKPRSFGGSIDISSKVTFSGVARFASSADAKQAADEVRSSLGTAKAKAVLDSSDISQDGATVTGSIRLSASATREMLRDVTSDGW